MFALTFLLGGLFIVGVLHTYANLAQLRLCAGAAPPGIRGPAGEIRGAALRDEGRRAHDGITLSWPGGDEIGARVAPLGEDHVQLFTRAARRGWLRPGRLRLESRYPLGLLRAWSWLDLDMRCLVYPRPAPAGPLPLDAGRGEEGSATHDPGAEDFSGFRNYTPGDPLRHVAWKTLAKGQPLQTREYVAFADRRVWLTWAQTADWGATEQRLALLCRAGCWSCTRWVPTCGSTSRARGSNRRRARRSATARSPPSRCSARRTRGRAHEHALAAAQPRVAAVRAGARDRAARAAAAAVGTGGHGCRDRVRRYRVHQGAWSFPGRAVKLLLVVMSFLAVGLHWRALSGLEPAVALLAIAGGLKAMEMRTTRDFLVVVFVAYFLVASQLLFEQEIPYALYAVVATAGVTAAMVARHQGRSRAGIPAPARADGQAARAGRASDAAAVRGVPAHRAAVGDSAEHAERAHRAHDSMSPGGVARLSGSNALALRATFEGAIPAQRRLWRGLVFSEFDGRQWRQGAMARMEAELAQQGAPRGAAQARAERRGNQLRSDPRAQQPAVACVIGFPLSYDANLRSSSDFRLMSSRPLTQRLRYRVRADLGAQLEARARHPAPAHRAAAARGLQPARARAGEGLACRGTVGCGLHRARAAVVREEEFVYTMSPPLLGRDTVDEFLFGERRGFCEHYASAFAVLLRAASIRRAWWWATRAASAIPPRPTCWCTRLQTLPRTALLGVAELRVRFDPTAAVAPDRIESGAGEALGAEFLADSPLAIERYRNVRLLGWMRMRWDMMTYHLGAAEVLTPTPSARARCSRTCWAGSARRAWSR